MIAELRRQQLWTEPSQNLWGSKCLRDTYFRLAFDLSSRATSREDGSTHRPKAKQVENRREPEWSSWSDLRSSCNLRNAPDAALVPASRGDRGLRRCSSTALG